MNKNPTQAEKIHAFLLNYGCIDFMTAWNELGISRLSARIYELEHEKGVEIEHRNRCFKAKDGTTCSYINYVLKEKHDGRY